MAVTYTTINGYQVPVYSQDTFKPWQKDILGTVDAGDGSNYGVIGTENAWGLDANDAYSLYGSGSPYNYWANWSLTPTGKGVNDAGGFGYNIDPSGFDGLLKVGEHEGMRVRYSLQDGQYVPTLVGNEAWRSNRDNTGDFTALAMALTAGAAGMLSPAATAGASGTAGSAAPMTTYGVLDASVALPGTSFIPAAGTSSMAVIPNAGWNIAPPAAGAPSEATMIGPGSAPGMFDGMTSRVSEALKGTGLSDDLIKQLAPSLVKLGTGLYGKYTGDKYVDQLFDQKAQAAGDYRDAWTQYASGLEGLFAPTAGRYGAMRDNYLGASEGMFGQLKDFNPQTFASDRYRAMQDLIAPQRAIEQQGLMQDLFNKGGFGLTVNTPGSAGGVAGINPYVDTLVNRWGQQDKQMAYDALGQGESYLDNLIRRQAGMFGQGVGADAIGVGRGEQVLSANRDATTRYIEAILKAQAARTGANAGSSTEFIEGLGGALGGVDWGDVWDKIGGIFGSN